MKSNIFMFVFLLIVLFIGCHGNDGKIQVASIRLSVQSDTIDLNQTCTLTVYIEDILDMFAITFDISYEDSLINTVDMQIPASSIFTDSILSFYHVDENKTSVSIGKTQTDSNDNVSGSGIICDLIFLSVGTGTCTFHIENVMIVDEVGQTSLQLDDLELYNSDIFIE